MPAGAQSASSVSPSPPQHVLDARHAELLSWLEAYRRWEAWILEWGNRVAYNAAGGLVTNRPDRPEPPNWVWQDCASLLDADGALGEACAILAHWDDLVPYILSRRHVGGLASPTDLEERSSFLRRIHLTGGWVPAQLPAPDIYLAIGMQVGVVELGRLTLPAIGVGLMAMANQNGGYDWKPATVIGVGYRLSSFAFPWVRRQASLHANLARVTIHGVRTLPVGIDPSQNFIGLSLTFSKAR